jgi:hypothetical protein
MSISSNLKLPFASASLVAVFVSIASLGIPIYEEYFGKFPVLINSSPSKAEIFLEGNRLGETPLIVELKKGTYSLNAKKKGYESLEHAMYVKSSRNNSVSLRLVLSDPAPVSSSSTTEGTTSSTLEIEELSKKIEKLSSIIVLDPESATTIPILTEKVLVQAEAIKALRVEIRDVREQSKWYLGSMIAIIVGLLGVIATLFVSSRGK